MAVGLLISPSILYAQQEELNVSITSMPETMLFNDSNLKPGDIVTKSLIVRNDGNTNYYFFSSVEQTGGSLELFEFLELRVLDSDGLILYGGNLNGFEGLDPRYLAVDSEEEITFEAHFPFGSGNKFQGEFAEFQIIFWAEASPVTIPEDSLPGEETDHDGPGESAGPPPAPGGSTPTLGGGLPQTGEQIPFLYYLIGTFLLVAGIYLYQQRRCNKVKVQH